MMTIIANIILCQLAQTTLTALSDFLVVMFGKCQLITNSEWDKEEIFNQEQFASLANLEDLGFLFSCFENAN